MRRLVLLAGMLVVVVLAGCSSSNNNRTATATRPAATPRAMAPSPRPQVATASSTPAVGAAPPTPTRAAATTAAATAAPAGTAAPATVAPARAQAVESRLTPLGLTAADVPQPLLLTAKRPFNNQDYASGQPDPAGYAKALNDQGRISGVLIQYQFAGTATPPPDAPVVLGLLDILSSWQDEDAAKAGLQMTLKQVTPGGPQSSSVQQTSESVDLSPVPDVLQATHLHITSVVPGQVNSDVYIVGLQHGTDTALLIISGQNGVPTLDQLKQIAGTQSRRLSGSSV